MKITRLETLIAFTGPPDLSLNRIFLKVHTDEGITGIGEVYPVGPDRGTEQVIEHFAEWIVGHDPMENERIWALLYQGSRFPGGSMVNAAISGIDIALWDIKGKALGVPVYQLLGGKCRDRIRIYHGAGGPTPEAAAERALGEISRYGITAFKVWPFPPGFEALPWPALVRAARARLEAIRRAVGDDVELGVEAHATIFEPFRALDFARALAEYRLLFLEEPIRPENLDALAQLKAQLPVPLATGENLYTKFQFRDLLAKQAADIIQPDVCITGGLTEMKKIAAMAEAHYVVVAPHGPLGPVATAANAHFAASTPNLLVLEHIADDLPPRRELVVEPLAVRDGYLELPTAAGLGVELNEEAFARYPYRSWHRVSPIRPDGSVGFN